MLSVSVDVYDLSTHILYGCSTGTETVVALRMHYSDVMMGAMASQIISLTIV